MKNDEMKKSEKREGETIVTFAIPEEVVKVSDQLLKNNFEAYLIGGCVRDLMLGRKPKDWDITTNANPDEIIKLFEKTFYENEYGTVGVVNEETEDETLKIVEVTPYRLEEKYSDNRRPDSVKFSGNLADDLKRRDFTINAIALKILERDSKKGLFRATITDLFEGLKDLKSGIVRSVGEPIERFSEDALRIIRAVRIATELGFSIESNTESAIGSTSTLLQKIAGERIRDEFVRILMSDNPMAGFNLCRKLGIMKYIVPELEDGIGVDQNQAHSYDVWEHIMRSVQHGAEKKWSLDVRLATVFHDIGKPATRLWSNEKKDWTFHGHDMVGAKITAKAMARLRFSKKEIDKIIKLVRWHMFFSDTEVITLSAVRRIISKVGVESMDDLMKVRMCDRIGTGRPKESPYRLRKYQSMIEEAMRDPISVSMLKISGGDILRVTGLTPGPKIGNILHALLEEVLEDPKLNNVEYLENRAKILAEMSDINLKKIGDLAKEKKENKEQREIEEIRKKYWVK
jgi:poly(A) polymerase/tRNA nucleotidyltransferase (CCA-adding enzyme)